MLHESGLGRDATTDKLAADERYRQALRQNKQSMRLGLRYTRAVGDAQSWYRVDRLDHELDAKGRAKFRSHGQTGDGWQFSRTIRATSEEHVHRLAEDTARMLGEESFPHTSLRGVKFVGDLPEFPNP